MSSDGGSGDDRSALFLAESIVYCTAASVYIALFSYTVHRTADPRNGWFTPATGNGGFQFYCRRLGVLIAALLFVGGIDPHSAHGILRVPAPILIFDAMGSTALATFSIWLYYHTVPLFRHFQTARAGTHTTGSREYRYPQSLKVMITVLPVYNLLANWSFDIAAGITHRVYYTAWELVAYDVSLGCYIVLALVMYVQLRAALTQFIRTVERAPATAPPASAPAPAPASATSPKAAPAAVKAAVPAALTVPLIHVQPVMHGGATVAAGAAATLPPTPNPSPTPTDGSANGAGSTSAYLPPGFVPIPSIVKPQPVQPLSLPASQTAVASIQTPTLVPAPVSAAAKFSIDTAHLHAAVRTLSITVCIGVVVTTILFFLSLVTAIPILIAADDTPLPAVDSTEVVINAASSQVPIIIIEAVLLWLGWPPAAFGAVVRSAGAGIAAGVAAPRTPIAAGKPKPFSPKHGVGGDAGGGALVINAAPAGAVVVHAQLPGGVPEAGSQVTAPESVPTQATSTDRSAIQAAATGGGAMFVPFRLAIHQPAAVSSNAGSGVVYPASPVAASIVPGEVKAASPTAVPAGGVGGATAYVFPPVASSPLAATTPNEPSGLSGVPAAPQPSFVASFGAL